MTQQLIAALQTGRVVVKKRDNVAGAVAVSFPKQYIKGDVKSPPPIVIDHHRPVDLLKDPFYTVDMLRSSNLDQMIVRGKLQLI